MEISNFREEELSIFARGLKQNHSLSSKTLNFNLWINYFSFNGGEAEEILRDDNGLNAEVDYFSDSEDDDD